MHSHNNLPDGHHCNDHCLHHNSHIRDCEDAIITLENIGLQRGGKVILENVDLTINKVGKLSFSIYSDHPYFDRLEKKSSKISVFKDGKTIFRGRIIEDEQGLYNDKSVLCEYNCSECVKLFWVF